MKLCKLLLTLLLITWLASVDARGRSVERQGRGRPFTFRQAYDQSSTVELELSYDFSAPGQTRRISFIVPLPQDVPDRQKILSIQYNPKPSRTIERNGNRYAEFVFTRPQEKIKATVRIRAELFRYDLITAMK